MSSRSKHYLIFIKTKIDLGRTGKLGTGNIPNIFVRFFTSSTFTCRQEYELIAISLVGHSSHSGYKRPSNTLPISVRQKINLKRIMVVTKI